MEMKNITSNPSPACSPAGKHTVVGELFYGGWYLVPRIVEKLSIRSVGRVVLYLYSVMVDTLAACSHSMRNWVLLVFPWMLLIPLVNRHEAQIRIGGFPAASMGSATLHPPPGQNRTDQGWHLA